MHLPYEATAFPPPAAGSFIYIQERYQHGFSTHVSERGYLYEATALQHQHYSGPWATVDAQGLWRDFYGRTFTWRPAQELKPLAARLYFELINRELVELDAVDKILYPELPALTHAWCLELIPVTPS